MARLPYLTRNDLPADQQSHWDGLVGEGRNRLPLVTQVLMHRPALAASMEHLNHLVRFELSLPRSAVELVVLSVARDLDCMRAWAVHVPQARNEGVREEAIDSIKNRRAPEGLSEEEAELVTFAQELVRTKRVSDKAFEAARARLGDQGVVDLTGVASVYCMLSAAMNAFEIEPPEDKDLLLPP
jgi:4-carboxymuconolactone decarboxylase